MGSRLGPFGTLQQYGIDHGLENAQVVQVDADHRVLELVRDVALGIDGDAGAAAAGLLARLREMGERVRCPGARPNAWPRSSCSARSGRPSSTCSPQAEKLRIPPRRALAQLAKALPRNAMVSTDIGNVCSVANSYLKFEQPLSFLAAMSWGNCGYAYPTALGAKVARPDRAAIAYVGDGAWGMSLAEVMTA